MKTTVLGVLVKQRGWSKRQFVEEYLTVCRREWKATNNPVYANPELNEWSAHRWITGALRGLPRMPAPKVLPLIFDGYTINQLFEIADPSAPFPTVEPQRTESDIILMSARDAAERATEAATRVLPDMALDQTESDIQDLAQQYHQLPPFAVFGRANELHAALMGFLDQTRKVPQLARLNLAAGQTTAILATTTFDLGNLAAAGQYARATVNYADLVEDGALKAFGLSELAIIAYWSGRSGQAVRYIQEALVQPGLGTTARRRLYAIAARAFAHAGDTTAATDAAQQALADGPEDTDKLHNGLGGVFGFPRQRAVMSNATTYLLLGNGAAAEDSALHALELMAEPAHHSHPQEATDSAQAELDLARARFLQGEVDGALEAAAPALSLPPGWRVEGIVSRATGLRADMARNPRCAAAAPAGELADRIEGFVALNAGSQLGGRPAIG